MKNYILENENTEKNCAGCCNTGNCNTGNCNTGNCNAGNCNTGDFNTGDWNSGDYNTGQYNTGDYNTGDHNTGNCNTGDHNTGNCNVGNCNTGDFNTGDWNSGDYNVGDWNTGNRNTGDWNKSSFNTGCFNTKNQKIFMFNKPSNWTYDSWLMSEARQYLNQIPKNVVEWIRSREMTDEEKAAHPEYKTTGGYLKVLDESECAQMWWDELSEYERAVIMELPNFDEAIFEEVTGIKIR